MAKATKPPSKTEIFASIAETTGLTKRDIGNVFDALNDQIKKAVGRSGSKTFAIPGLCYFPKCTTTPALTRRLF